MPLPHAENVQAGDATSAYPPAEPSNPIKPDEGVPTGDYFQDDSVSGTPHYSDHDYSPLQAQTQEPWTDQAAAVAQPLEQWSPQQQWQTGQED
jgi:hypothetical protein